jgi:hypothetical protein
MRARTFQTIVFLLFVAPLGGCGTTSEQRVAQLQRAVTATQEMSKQVSAKVTELQGALANAQALAKNSAATPAQIAKLTNDITTIQAKLATAKPLQDHLDQQLAAYQTQLTAALTAGPLDAAGEAQVYGQGVSAVGAVLPPPWNIYAGLVGSLIGIVGGVVGTVARGRKADAAMAGTVAGVTQLLDALPTPDQVTKAAAAGVTVIDAESAKNMLARSQAKDPVVVTAVQKALVAQS